MQKFLTSNNKIILQGGAEITSDMILSAVEATNERIKDFVSQFPDIALSMNEGGALTSTVGSVFNDKLVSIAQDLIIKNPYLGGNPDLLNISTPSAKKYFTYSLNEGDMKSLGLGGIYKYGGVEVKATSTDMNWSAHHRGNHNLLGILCDYISNCIQIVGVMYSPLTEDDWGKVSNIEDNKSTNSCRLNSYGKAKMRAGWLCVLNDIKYVSIYHSNSDSGQSMYDAYEENHEEEFYYQSLW